MAGKYKSVEIEANPISMLRTARTYQPGLMAMGSAMVLALADFIEIEAATYSSCAPVMTIIFPSIASRMFAPR